MLKLWKIICNKFKTGDGNQVDLSTISINTILALWGNGGEVTLNDCCCNVISSILKKDYSDYSLSMRKKFGNIGYPDCVIYKGKIAKTIIEFKLTKQAHSLNRSVCQIMCYIYSKYGDSIIPIRNIVVWTENNVYLFSWDKLEQLYDNFITYYKGETPTGYWDICPRKDLFKDVKDLSDEIISLKELDFNNFTKKLVA